MTVNYNPRCVQDGLVFYVDAANIRSYPRTGTTLFDTTEFGNNGTLTNGPSFSSQNGGLLSFDGIDDFVSVNSNSALNPTNAATIGSWVNFNSASINNRIIFFGKGDGNTNANTQYWLEKNANNQFSTYFSIENTSKTLTPTNFIASSDTWYYFISSYDGSKLKIYINGVLIGSSTTFSGSITTTNVVLGIGKLGSYSSLRLNGKIASSFIYNRALSDSEIWQNYNATRSRFEQAGSGSGGGGTGGGLG